MAFTLPSLPYPTDGLEPLYDKATLEVHHGKHHATYVEKLNAAIGNHAWFAGKSIETVLANPEAIPQGIRRAVLNHGGGHANHSLFWTVLGKDKGGEPTGKLAEAINREFHSFAEFKQKFTAQAADLFGSGWTFLSQDQEDKLHIRNLPNQDTPISMLEKPLLLIDLWEHAYYLKWKNKRPEWIETWWNLVDWDKVEQLHAEEPAWYVEQTA